MAQKELNVRLGLYTADFEKKLKGVNRSLASFQRQVEGIGRGLSKSLTLPIVALGGIATKTFVDFELSMAKVKAVSGATEAQFKTLNDSALELGRTTQFTASEVSSLQLSLSKLGFSPDEINKSTAAILDLALATGEDLAQSATVAAATLKGFELPAEEMIRVTNIMADSFSSSALDLSKFQTAMRNVAPVANVAGASIEETTALLSVLTNRGVDAASAGTGLRNAFLRLADKGMTLAEGMAQVKNSVDPLSEAMKLFGTKGAVVATILANNREEIEGLTADYIDNAGESRRMAAIMENTLSGSLNKLKSAVEGAGISIGEILAPTIGKVADSLVKAVTQFNNLDSGTKKVIVKVLAFSAALGPGILLLGKLIALRQGINSSLLAINTAFKTTVGSIISINKETRAMTTNFAKLLSPQLLIVAAVVGVAVVAWKEFTRRVNLANAAQNALADVNKQANTELAKEKALVDPLIETLKKETTSREDKLTAINKLQEISPEFFGNLNLEKSTLQDITKASDEFNSSMLARAKARAVDARLTEEATKQLELEERKRKIIADSEKGGLSAFAIGAVGGTEAPLKRIQQELEASQKASAALTEEFLKSQRAVGALSDEEKKAAAAKAKSVEELDELEKTLGKSEAARERAKAAALAEALGGTKKIKDVYVEIGKELDAIEQKGNVFGDTFNVDDAKIKALTGGVEKLLNLGVGSGSGELQKLITQIETLRGGPESTLQPLASAGLKPSLENKHDRFKGIDFDFGLGTANEETIRLNTNLAALKPTITDITETQKLLGVEIQAQAEAALLASEKMKEKLNFIRDTIIGVLDPAFGALFDKIAIGGANAFKSFADAAKQALIQLVKQMVVALAKAIAIAAVFAIFAPGAVAQGGKSVGALFKLFSGIPKFASGGVVPPGFPGDTYPAFLSSGETVTPPGSLPTGGANIVIGGEFILRGDDLYLQVKKAERKNNRI